MFVKFIYSVFINKARTKFLIVFSSKYGNKSTKFKTVKHSGYRDIEAKTSYREVGYLKSIYFKFVLQ